jgi:hypothetical protein
MTFAGPRLFIIEGDVNQTMTPGVSTLGMP